MFAELVKNPIEFMELQESLPRFAIVRYTKRLWVQFPLSYIFYPIQL